MSRRINQSWWKGGRLIGRIDPKQVREKIKINANADSRDRTSDLQIFSLTLSQLSYTGDGWEAGREERVRKKIR